MSTVSSLVNGLLLTSVLTAGIWCLLRPTPRRMLNGKQPEKSVKDTTNTSTGRVNYGSGKTVTRSSPSLATRRLPGSPRAVKAHRYASA